MKITTRLIRELILLSALIWTLSFGLATVAQSRAELQRIQQRVELLSEAQHTQTLQVEQRLTRLETQLAALIDLNGKVVWGTFGTFALFVAQALWGLIASKRARD